MELKFTDLDTMNSYEKFDYESYEKQNGGNYWEKSSNIQEKDQKKKKISFNDILSNMNLAVNKDGVLQLMTINKQDTTVKQPQNYNAKTYNQNDFKQQTKQIKNTEPLDAGVKHSYIYNKYFKDYGDPNAGKPAPRVPKTIEEYRKMLLEDKIKAIEHKKMIEEVKSKKMMFTSAPGAMSNPRIIKPSINNLRTMNFR